MPVGGCSNCHPDWGTVVKAQPTAMYSDEDKWYANQACYRRQTDLRHHLGKAPGTVKFAVASIPTILCDEAGWVRIDDILTNDLLWSHWKRDLDYQLSHRDVEERQRQLQRRLQVLFGGNYTNSRLCAQCQDSPTIPWHPNC